MMETVIIRVVDDRCIETVTRALEDFKGKVVAVAVGPPVTRRPPHRFRRAVFSPRARQQDALPQVG